MFRKLQFQPEQIKVLKGNLKKNFFFVQSNRQRVASGNSYCCALITRHPVGAESMADSVSEVS